MKNVMTIGTMNGTMNGTTKMMNAVVGTNAAAQTKMLIKASAQSLQ